jgi:hypothetical protein
VICPAVSKLYFVHNATNQVVVFKTSAGTGVSIPVGSRIALYCNATNVVPAVDDLPAASKVAGIEIVTVSGTQTLTNKTINLTSNTLQATSAQIAAAVTDETGTGALVFAGSPALTGTPTAPTAAAGTNTTQVASTAHVFAERANTATLTNKTISGSNNTLSNIGNASLTNSSLTIGSTNIALGGTAASLAGLTGVTATTFTGALSGNATTATTLQTTRAINGTNFNGSAAITTANWGTARTIWGQSINGSANITAPLLPAAGSVTAPAFSTSGDTNTGIYFPAADQAAITTGGTARLTVTTAQFTGTLPWRGQNGTAAAPALSASGDTNTGIYFPAADTIGFTEGGVEAMRINSAGDVGIGTTSPGRRLDVEDGGVRVVQWTAPTTGALTIRDASSNANGGYIQWVNNANSVERGFIAIDPSNNMRFATGSTERMRIDSSGNLLVGATSPFASSKLSIESTNGTQVGVVHNNAGGQSYLSNGVAAASTAWAHFYGVSSNNTVQNIFIYGNGNIQNANNSYGSLSDIKWKENIADATPKLDKLCQVRVVNYNLKGGYEQHKQIGVIAQELEQIFPSMVDETPDRDKDGNDLGTTTKSVKYSVFVPMLIKAMQELKAENDALKARLDAANL